MDPLSVTVGALVIIGAALKSVGSLINIFRAIKDAPKDITALINELTVVRAVLVALHDAQKYKAPTPEAYDALEKTIENCKSTCEWLGESVKNWIKVSDGRTHWRKRACSGLLFKEEIKVLRKQPSRCKITVNLAVSTTTLDVLVYAHVLTTEATSNASTTLMRARLEQKETKISEFDIQQKEAIIAIEQMLQAFMVDVLG